MSRTLITPARPVAPRVRPNRFLAAGLAAVVAAAGAIAFAGDDPVAPATPNAAPAPPVTFGEAPVVKGARGGKTDPLTLRGFGDPTDPEGCRRRGDPPGAPRTTRRVGWK